MKTTKHNPLRDLSQAIPKHRAEATNVRAASLDTVHSFLGDALGCCDLTDAPKLVSVFVPSDQTSYARVIRVHELIHSRISPKKCPNRKGIHPSCIQAVEDMLVQQRMIPMARSDKRFARDCMAYVLRDLKMIADCDSRDLIKFHNSIVVIMLRAMATPFDYIHDKYRDELLKRIYQKYPLVSSINTSITMPVNRALSTYQRYDGLFIRDEDDKPEDDKPPVNPRLPGERSVDESNREDMQRLTPKLDVPCNRKMRSKRIVRGVSGAFQTARYIKLLTSSSGSCKLWSRVRRARSDDLAILIDISGSMAWARDRLIELTRALPQALVAFYGGSSIDPNRYYGDLNIVARAGKRVSDDWIKQAREHYGSNACDYAAIGWLLEQRSSRLILVSDLQFCSGRKGQDLQAHTLLRANIDRVEVVTCLTEFERLFGKLETSY
jgi:hypothetical protein